MYIKKQLLSRTFRFSVFVCFFSVLLTLEAQAAAKLPLPRFVILRSDNIVMRAGPGREYPIKWRLKRKGLPVKIIAEYDTWRHVECHDGTKGWIHQSLLSGKRNLLITDGPKLLLSSPNRDAKPKVKLATGILLTVKVSKCTSNRCPVTVQNMKGWIEKSDTWGLLETE